MASSSLFSALPPEVVGRIISQVDPITLIALSETSTWLRDLIRPTRHDYVRRLLALELLPEHGGIVPLFRARDNKITPPPGTTVWRNNKYACCGCMQLLPHMMFDNHAILRLRYRKPPPGSVEAEKCLVTDWEPLEPSARWRRIQSQADRERQEQRKWRIQYHRAVTGPFIPDTANPFGRPDYRLADAVAEEAEKYLCGTSRQKRRCLDCKRQPGRPPLRNGSNATFPVDAVPLAISRQLYFVDKCSYFFPGLFESVPLDMTPKLIRVVHRPNAKDFPITLRTARCPSCGSWQEQGAFRCWDTYDARLGRDTLCNHCEARKDPASHAKILSQGVVEMIEDALEFVVGNLIFGWERVEADFNRPDVPGEPPLLAPYQSVREEILGGLNWIVKDGRKCEIVFKEFDLPHLRRRMQRYKDFIYNELDRSIRAEIMQSWHRLWVEEYDLLESRYRWLKRCITWVEDHPNLVLDYIFEQDPHLVWPVPRP
ncbi:hypothetical protein MMYC01_207769 [Madurella mycetomatis]|uniref:F-box domain-containing protein n=1 Tax=Madurella mycetomatis TaxID=100816 RepID=A0A175VU60_9PEZI|nr:hypothetical protein MMYC01_207769 [Madurella mycetomatis]